LSCLCGTGGSNPSFSAKQKQVPRRGILIFGPLPNLFEQWGKKKNDKGASPAIVFVLGEAKWDRYQREQSLI
jgi:hypothetical protein